MNSSTYLTGTVGEAPASLLQGSYTTSCVRAEATPVLPVAPLVLMKNCTSYTFVSSSAAGLSSYFDPGRGSCGGRGWAVSSAGVTLSEQGFTGPTVKCVQQSGERPPNSDDKSPSDCCQHELEHSACKWPWADESILCNGLNSCS